MRKIMFSSRFEEIILKTIKGNRYQMFWAKFFDLMLCFYTRILPKII